MLSQDWPTASHQSAVLLAVALHLKLLHDIALWRSLHPPYNHTEREIFPRSPSVLKYEVPGTAVASAIVLIILPYVLEPSNPLASAGLRVVCFFYACKSLDLGLARWHRPPTMLITSRGGNERPPAPIMTSRDVYRYSLALATQMRYLKFDIAARQRGRPAQTDRWAEIAWTVVPLTVLPTITYVVPITPLKCACLLTIIQLGLDGLHRLVHQRCDSPLFWRPWAARTMSSFWTIHWHSGAESFLRSLAYEPAKRLSTPLIGKQGGRAVGVLAAFALSGLWHGWASAPATTAPYLLAFQVWALFLAFGVACLAEQAIWGNRQGGTVQRIAVWTYALCGAGICARTLECYCKIDLVKRTQCPR